MRTDRPPTMTTPPASETHNRSRPGRPRGHDPRRPARREKILEAACRAILKRGFPATRITDIAAAAGTSTGTIHYYFATKDEVLVAALAWAGERLFARVEDPAVGDDPAARMGHLLRVSVPTPGASYEEYVLWVEMWVRVLHQPELLPTSEALSARWRGYFFALVRRGAAAGTFAPVAEPDVVADRIIAMVDGLGFETALRYSWTSPERMRERLFDFAAEQLGVARTELEAA
jgi:AcrR family transcriptional regulator